VVVKTASDSADATWRGRSFQTVAPETGNASFTTVKRLTRIEKNCLGLKSYTQRCFLREFTFQKASTFCTVQPIFATALLLGGPSTESVTCLCVNLFLQSNQHSKSKTNTHHFWYKSRLTAVYKIHKQQHFRLITNRLPRLARELKSNPVNWAVGLPTKSEQIHPHDNDYYYRYYFWNYYIYCTHRVLNK